MNRQGLEFKKPEKLKMFLRAGGPAQLRCEACRLLLCGKSFEYDHSVEIWELSSELRERLLKEGVPAEYGKLLCIPCHDEKSGKKTGERAHGKRILSKAAKANTSRRPMPGSKASNWKHRMDGTWVRR